MRKIFTFLCAALMSVGMFAATVTWNNNDITSSSGYGTSFTKDGVTITAGIIDFNDKNFMDGGTFTTTLGNFTKIEVTAMSVSMLSGEGWSGNTQKKTWTGNASSVSFSGDIMGMGMGNTQFVFTIEEPTVAVIGVTLNQNEAQMTVGGETLTLTATVNPNNATDQSVSWSTSDGDVATVDNGVVTAVAAGNATITVTTTDGSFTATCAVTVTAPQPAQEESLLTTLTFGGSDTYGETTSGVVTVTATNVGSYNGTYGWLLDEGGSLSVTAKEGYTITKCVFHQNAKTPITDTEAPFEIHANDWGTIIEDPIYDMNGVTSIEVYGYANPGGGSTEPIVVTWNDYDLPSSGSGKSFTKDGVTITCGGIEWEDLDFYNGGTFTTDLGNFTKIEVYAGRVTTPFGEGWSGSNERQTWTGNASSVSFSGEFMSAGEEVNLTFTIEPKGSEPTAVENVQTNQVQGTKILRNGQLLIEKNGKIYNVMGAEVK